MSNAAELKTSKLTSDFFKMPTSEQIEKFKDYSIEEQYELFLFGNQVLHPPAIYLSRTFAEQDGDIIPFLKEKIEETDNEVTLRDIVSVFSEMATLKVYKFSDDPSLMMFLKSEANNMSGIWKETTLKMISEME